MPILVANCPRCGAEQMTFDVPQVHLTERIDYGWKHFYEVFSICRKCDKSITFILTNRANTDYKTINGIGLMEFKDALNKHMEIDGFIGLKNLVNVKPPEYIPEEIEDIFREGATCLAVECWNAAGTMFRLCLDHATRSLMPSESENQTKNKLPSKAVQRSLGLRIKWLFENILLPEALLDLSTCIKDDGNDGAHAGTLGKKDAEDILDFTVALLERLYTEPEKLRLAAVRRDTRREGS